MLLADATTNILVPNGSRTRGCDRGGRVKFISIAGSGLLERADGFSGTLRSENQCQGLGVQGASIPDLLRDEALGWKEMQGCGGGTWVPPAALFPIYLEGEEKELCPPPRALLQPSAFLWVLCSRSIWTLVDHPLGCKQPVLLYLGHILLGLGKDVMDAAVPKIPVGLRPFTCQETAGCPLLLLVFKGSQMKFSRFPPALVPAASNVLPVSAFQLPLLVKLLFWSCFPSAS